MILEDDYKVFGGFFVVLIISVKDLLDACKKIPKDLGLANA